MNVKDQLGLFCTGANPISVEHFSTAQQQFQCYINDPLATLDLAIDAAPGFVMAHVLKAYLHLLGTEPGDIAIANTYRKTAERIGGSEREKAHVKAISAILKGRWRAAGRILEDISIQYPADIIALQAGHLVDFNTGNSGMLRARIARALPSWTRGMPGYHSLLGMYAFGLEETGHYTLAESFGRASVALNPRDGWGQHAVAHVMEMQGRTADGIAWMTTNSPDWTKDSFFKVHNWWHLALYYLDQQDFDDVIRLFDGPVYGEKSGVVLDMVDASALLWRLNLLGIDVGNRWQAVADNWSKIAKAGNYSFNDFHAAMAFAGADRMEAVDEILEVQRDAMYRGDDNAGFTRDVGHPLTLSVKAFCNQDYSSVIELVRPLREIANRFGGSHAQRDIIDLTLIEAAIRGGERSLAKALVNERLMSKPASAANRVLSDRANRKQSSARSQPHLEALVS